MPRRLDPRFRAIISYMDGATSNLERDAARQNAEAVARACGFTFAEALAELRRPAGCRQMSSAEPEPVASDEPSPHLSYPSLRDEMIAEALAADPSRSDRDIAREACCSPTLVGRRRAEAGLARGVRSVTRKGRAYEMRLGGAHDAP